MFEQKLKACQDSNTDDVLDTIVAKTGLKLAHTLLKEEAVLMPDLYTYFLQNLKDPLNTSGHLVTPPTINWLLNSLKLYFKDVLGVVCKHKRYGTLLYRKGGDLQNALLDHWACSKKLTKGMLIFLPFQ